MPKRTDISSVLLIGSGPIVIGQACEFDYSGSQGLKALKEEGFRVILVNSNPATVMTDPQFADATYVEPITPEVVERVIAKERPDALLPTLGGQTALNTAVELAKRGVLERYDVQLIGADIEAIEKAEDRERFKEAMQRIGIEMAESAYVTSMEDAREAADRMGFPLILRPSFTLGGVGGGIARSMDDYESRIEWALSQSPNSSVLVESSILGWKEYELEVMRDGADNVVIICSIENFDPMGVHTGDSITVAPAMTLTDVEYQRLRDAALDIIREIGVDTGGSNIQFAVNPEDGRIIVIEMNPRVSRSSALASKATGFPIAKIATKLAVGYTLDELRNDITRETPASFEPTLDYVVVKCPRFNFEKFPGAEDTLTTQMKSVGEAMAIGRTFREALQKALRSLETGAHGLDLSGTPGHGGHDAAYLDRLRADLERPSPGRIYAVAQAMRAGLSQEEIFERTAIDPWFLSQLRSIVDTEKDLAESGKVPGGDELFALKQMGFSDERIARLCASEPEHIRATREAAGIAPVYKRVDTCAAEFEAHTPYLYSSWEEECEAEPTDREKVIILGGGPIRIGQGIEFDYCCVHAAWALREAGFETVMVNCNPETVSTDYDTSDRLYFEPLTFEDVLHVVRREQSIGTVRGVIVQFGGQTPLKLSHALEKAGVPILGTSTDAIDRAEDRDRFQKLLDKLGLRQAPGRIVYDAEGAVAAASDLGYPVLVRPSYVLGGRGMLIAWDPEDLLAYIHESARVSPEHPLLVDSYLQGAIELDADCVSDGREVVIGGVMEHIEEAGVHSGDSACCLPPHSVGPEVIARIEEQTRALAQELGVIGLMNVQFAVRGDEVYILEVNPRASRTVPFVGKATGQPLARIAARCMLGATLEELGVKQVPTPKHFSVKEAVFPFTRFPGVDILLGPEMRSTGEVMGVGGSFGMAFANAQLGASNGLPGKGRWLISVRSGDKEPAAEIAARLIALGYEVEATGGTADVFEAAGIAVTRIHKVREGTPNCVTRIEEEAYCAVVNTERGRESTKDSFSIRRAAITRGLPYFTTIAAAQAALEGVSALAEAGGELPVRSLQEYYERG